MRHRLRVFFRECLLRVKIHPVPEGRALDPNSADYLYLVQQQKRLSLASSAGRLRLGNILLAPLLVPIVLLKAVDLWIANLTIRAIINEQDLLRLGSSALRKLRARSLAFIKRYAACGALLVLDVDRLKPINDAFGHAAGDQVLKAIAKTLASHVRASDVIGRLGGDEFAMLLWNLSETDARAKAAALEQAVDALRFSFGGGAVKTGASVGVAILNSHSEMRTALDQADSAMYVRKAQRRHEAA